MSSRVCRVMWAAQHRSSVPGLPRCRRRANACARGGGARRGSNFRGSRGPYSQHAADAISKEIFVPCHWDAIDCGRLHGALLGGD